MKALQLLKELQNGVIPFDEEISKAIQELEILEIEIAEIRDENKLQLQEDLREYNKMIREGINERFKNK